MPTDCILVVGSGGHAAVVLDALMAGHFSRSQIHVLDSEPTRVGASIMGGIIQHLSALDHMPGAPCHVAIGDNRIRTGLLDRLKGSGLVPQSVVDQRAIVSSFAQIGAGSFVAAGAIISARSSLGEGCIINHGAVVDHDCSVGAACHLAPLSSLAGSVTLGEGVLVGAGARVLPGLVIGSGATIGAGAVVVTDVAEGMTVVGVPARRASQKGSGQ